MAKTLTAALKEEYDRLFADAKIRPERQLVVDASVDRIFAKTAMARYDAVSKKVGVPSFFIGIIHNMEAGLKFTGHLHNGDPLAKRTVQVPKGRPAGGTPPFTWEESAVDALTLHGLDKWTDWSVAGMAFQLEGYNGWGYRNNHPEVKSPYLWSFTTAYAAGKYVADGKFSATAVSQQVGAMALLKGMQLQNLIKLGAVIPPPTVKDETPGEVLSLAPSPVIVPFVGKVLRKDSSGADVRRLQDRLNALGIDVGPTDGDFGDRTEAGIRQFQARSEDSRGEPLSIDGIVGARTWEVLFGETSAPPAPAPKPKGKLLAGVLDVAASQLGVLEDPLGSNRGEMVDAYLNSVDKSLPGNPWCMAFVYWCFEQAAKKAQIPNPAPRTAGVLRSWQLAGKSKTATIVKAADAAKNPTLVQPGMVFYIDTGSGTGHTGFVTGVVNGRLTTIEGNTTLKTGSREGIGVFARAARRVDSINVGFVGFD